MVNHDLVDEHFVRLVSVHRETLVLSVILRSKATKNLEILRGVYPELAEGLRMT
jgi:hypothetical protein